jgi:hypothetical protein
VGGLNCAYIRERIYQGCLKVKLKALGAEMHSFLAVHGLSTVVHSESTYWRGSDYLKKSHTYYLCP